MELCGGEKWWFPLQPKCLNPESLGQELLRLRYSLHTLDARQGSRENRAFVDAKHIWGVPKWYIYRTDVNGCLYISRKIPTKNGISGNLHILCKKICERNSRISMAILLHMTILWGPLETWWPFFTGSLEILGENWTDRHGYVTNLIQDGAPQL